jgi:radical SAM protein with 4Fe4S-binding SPASM domain
MELYKIVDDSIQLGIKTISLSGGEPLESPYVTDFIRYVKKKGLRLLLYTCGNVESGKEIVPIDSEHFQLFKEVGVDKIIFSIHGHNAVIHEKVTTKEGSFNNLITSIKRAQKAGLVVELHVVPVIPNYRVLPQLIQLAYDLGIDQVSILRFVPQGRGATNQHELEITGERIYELNEILRSVYSNSLLPIRFGAPFNCFNINNQTTCTAGIDKAAMRPDGFVFPCVSMKRIIRFDVQEDIRNYSLIDIWEKSEIFNSVRRYLESIEESECKGCQNILSCHGSCYTQKHLLSQKTSTIQGDPYCYQAITERNNQTILDQNLKTDGGIAFESTNS